MEAKIAWCWYKRMDWFQRTKRTRGKEREERMLGSQVIKPNSMTRKRGARAAVRLQVISDKRRRFHVSCGVHDGCVLIPATIEFPLTPSQTSMSWERVRDMEQKEQSAKIGQIQVPEARVEGRSWYGKRAPRADVADGLWITSWTPVQPVPNKTRGGPGMHCSLPGTTATKNCPLSGAPVGEKSILRKKMF